MHSEEIQEILGLPPKALYRWGTLGIFLVLIGTLVACTFISYPVKVEGRLVLTTLSPPTTVATNVAGVVSEIYAAENEVVKNGDILMILTNTANYNHVLVLDTLSQMWLGEEEAVFLERQMESNLSLGEIQPAYTQFLRAIEDFKNGLNNTDNINNATSGDRQKISQLTNDNARLTKLIPKLQKELRKRQRKAAEQQAIFNSGNISRDRYFDFVNAVRRKEEDIEQAQDKIQQNNNAISALRSNIRETEEALKSEAKSETSSVKSSLLELRKALNDWREKYVLTAPKTGKVTFYNSQLQGKSVRKNEAILAILPINSDNTNDYVGTVELPTVGSGKVVEGVPVRVKFDSYPFLDYGHVVGTVESKAYLPKPDKEVYDLKISFPNGLNTSKNRAIPFRQAMTADVEIIMEEKNLLQRVFAKLGELFT